MPREPLHRLPTIERLREFVRRGQQAQEVIDELLRRAADPPAVHYLIEGKTPCRMPGLPCDWPKQHLWTQTKSEVTCPLCLDTL